MRTARAILEITRVATVRFQMSQDCEKERHSQRRFTDSTHDFQRELIRLFFIGTCGFRADGIVRRMAVVKMSELVCHDEHDASSKSSLKHILHMRILTRARWDPENFQRPVGLCRQLSGPLIFQHREVIGNWIEAVFVCVQPGISHGQVAIES